MFTDKTISNRIAVIEQMVLDRDVRYEEHKQTSVELMLSHVARLDAAINEGVHSRGMEITRIEDMINSIRSKLETAQITSEKAVAFALSATERAITKSEISSEKRFDSVNEFRKTLSDQTSTFVPRGEIESTFKNLQDKIISMDKTYGDRIADLKQYKDTASGQGEGKQQIWGYIIGATGVVSSLIAMIALLAKLH